MGRSQVKYNRTHGRPGTTKGRGSGGRGKTESRAPGQTINKPHQGDNTWRYETANSGPSSSHLEQLLDLETARLPHFSENTSEEESLLLKGINLVSMGKALAQLSVAERLRIPARLTVDLEDRSVGSKDRVSSHPVDGKVKNTVSENLDVKDDAEDDLDAWLDTVIA
jgi:hypothetical protein